MCCCRCLSSGIAAIAAQRAKARVVNGAGASATLPIPAKPAAPVVVPAGPANLRPAASRQQPAPKQ